MHAQAMFFAHAPNSFEFGDCVNRPEFGGLRDAYDTRFWIVNVVAPDYDAFDSSRIHFAILAGHEQDFGAVAEKFRRAAFVGFDVGSFMAKNAMIRLAHGGEREGVRSGAVEDEEYFAVRFEEFANQIRSFGRPIVVAVAADVPLIGLCRRSPGFGADARVIVAGELPAGTGNFGSFHYAHSRLTGAL
jgi:hypothetical protein